VHGRYRFRQNNTHRLAARGKHQHLLQEGYCFFDFVVQDNCVVPALSHLFQSNAGFRAMFEFDLKVFEYASDNVDGFLVTADQKAAEHGKLMLGGLCNLPQVTSVTSRRSRFKLPGTGATRGPQLLYATMYGATSEP
jgi:hypothetical protein